MASLEIEIVICTHNREALLSRALQFVNRATRPADCRIGVFVMANACTDGTLQSLEAYAKEAQGNPAWLPLRWEVEPLPGKSHALNSAIPLMQGTYTVFIDDDHRVDLDFLAAIARAIRDHPEKEMFCGRILPDWDGTEPSWVHDDGEYKIYPLPVPRFDLGGEELEVTRDIAVPGGGNLVIKTSLFAQVGNFSTELGPVGHNLGGAEDFDWVIRAYALGKTIGYCPDIIQYHYVDNERLKLSYIMRKAYERTCSTARLSEAAQNHKHLFPTYLVRKFCAYLMRAVFTLNPVRRRFYLVRLSAAAGEIKGFLITLAAFR
jgi:GT2 family glycosyltransferase